MKKNGNPSSYFEGLEGRKLERMKKKKQKTKEKIMNEFRVMWIDTPRGNFI